MSEHVSDLEVEQLSLGELDEARAAQVRALLKRTQDPRLATIAASNEEILHDYPAESMGPAIRRRLERASEEPERSPLRWMWIPVVGALAAALLVMMLRSESVPELEHSVNGAPIAELEPPEPDTAGLEPTRLKGDARLVIQRRIGTRSESVRPQAEVSAGDQLQLSYAAAGAAHGVIVSVDGAGAVTLHFPADAHASTALVEDGTVALDHSYELDDAPGFERFWLVTSDRPLNVQEVLDAAQAVADGSEPRTEELRVGDGARAKSLLLNKRVEP